MKGATLDAGRARSPRRAGRQARATIRTTARAAVSAGVAVVWVTARWVPLTIAKPKVTPLAMAVWIVLALATSPAAQAQSASVPVPELPRLDAELDPPTALTVGDRVQVRLTVVLPPSSRVDPVLPAWGQHWGSAEILSVGAPVELPLPPGGEGITPRRVRQVVTLMLFTTGRQVLPPMPVRVPLANGERLLTTPADLAITVRSVLPAPEAGEELRPRSHRPPRSLPWGWPFAATTGALAMALALATGLLLTRRPAVGGRRATEPPARAFARLLTALEAEPRPTGRAIPLHGRLALGARRYLGHRFRFAGAASTTAETLDHLARRTGLGPAFQRQAETLLRDCDAVRFAGAACDEDEWRARLRAGRQLLTRGEQEHAAWLARSLERRRQARREVHLRREERLHRRRPEDRRPWEPDPEALSADDRQVLRRAAPAHSATDTTGSGTDTRSDTAADPGAEVSADPTSPEAAP